MKEIDFSTIAYSVVRDEVHYLVSATPHDEVEKIFQEKIKTSKTTEEIVNVIGFL